MGASASRRTLSHQLRCLPQCLHAFNRFSGKVVRADEERIIVQRLGAWRFVVGIVQTNQGIPQERSELTACFVNLRTRRRGRLEDSWQVGSHLYVGVMIVVDSGSPFRSLATGEDWPRHLKFSRLASQADHVFGRLFPPRLFG